MDQTGEGVHFETRCEEGERLQGSGIGSQDGVSGRVFDVWLWGIGRLRVWVSGLRPLIVVLFSLLSMKAVFQIVDQVLQEGGVAGDGLNVLEGLFPMVFSQTACSVEA